MKKVCLLFIVCIHSLLSFSQLKSHVDERSELLGIVFRLAGAEEYVNNQVKNYAEDIDTYFAPYKNHPLIQYTKKIREENGIAYNAVAGLVPLLSIEKGRIALNKESNLDNFLNPSNQWNTENLAKFISLLDDFYRKTQFRRFFTGHQNLYFQAESRFNTLLDSIDTNWFSSFFGQALNDPLVIVSLTNGPNNYGGICTYKNKPSHSMVVIGCTSTDELNNPIFDPDQIMPVIIHEICHYYIDKLDLKPIKDMQASADKIFPFVQEQLLKRAYGDSKTMIYEYLANLCTASYFESNPTDFDAFHITFDETGGFIWLRDALVFLKNFTENRQLYPIFNDFMPQLVGFMNMIADNIENYVASYHFRFPQVISVYPAQNSIINADTKEFRVNFSHPMWEAFGTGKSDETNLEMPCIGDSYWSENRKTLIIPVVLEKGKQYGFKLLHYVFLSENAYSMEKDYEIRFQTEQ